MIGLEEEIQNISYELVKTCFKAYYRPSNQILFIAGNFDIEKIMDHIERIYEELETVPLLFHKVEIEEPKEVKKEKGNLTMPTGMGLTVLSYKICTKEFTPKELLKIDFYIYYFLKMNFGVTSKIYKDLISKKIIMDGISYSYSKYNDYLLIDIGVYTEEEKSFIESAKKVIQTPIYDESLFYLNQRKSKIEIAVRPERLGSIIATFLDNLLVYSYPYLDTIEDMENQSFEEFKKMINTLDFSHFTISIIKKEDH